MMAVVTYTDLKEETKHIPEHIEVELYGALKKCTIQATNDRLLNAFETVMNSN